MLGALLTQKGDIAWHCRRKPSASRSCAVTLRRGVMEFQHPNLHAGLAMHT